MPFATRILCLLALVFTLPAQDAWAQESESGWRFRQEVTIDRPGLVKLSLPPGTLDAGREDQEDLRMIDASGMEIPYLLERVLPEPEATKTARSHRVFLEKDATIVVVETGAERPVDGISIVTPSDSFIKAAQVEGSNDGGTWKLLLTGAPVFRQPGEEAHLRIAVPRARWRYLRIRLDDTKTAPVPVSGIRVHLAPQDAPRTPVPVRIRDRRDEPGFTRLLLDLGARHLTLASIRIETTDPLFTRSVAVRTQQIADHVVSERLLRAGTISRVAVAGQPVFENLEIPVDARIPSRQVLLSVENRDSPPIPIDSISATSRPVYIIFLARADRYWLLSGNRHCSAPAYDLSRLSSQLGKATVSGARIGPPAANPGYRSEPPIPKTALGGVPLDVSAWRYCKEVKIGGNTVHQLALDPQILSHARRDFGDVRLVLGQRQVPYLLEETSLLCPLKPAAATDVDPQHPSIGRWKLKLPYASLPLKQLGCRPRNPLFSRTVRLYENIRDERGSVRQRQLGQAAWVQNAEHPELRFHLSLQASPETDSMVLETDNGENPPLELYDFTFYYPSTRLLFLPPETGTLRILYGNEKALYPRYDIELAAQQLMESDRMEVVAGSEQSLKGTGLRERAEGKAGILFWAALSLAVLALFFVVSRLLPKGS